MPLGSRLATLVFAAAVAGGCRSHPPSSLTDALPAASAGDGAIDAPGVSASMDGGAVDLAHRETGAVPLDAAAAAWGVPAFVVCACPARQSSNSPICGATCGNGRRDSCPDICPPPPMPFPPPPPGDAGCPPPLEERCDGTELGGASCTSLAYAGGSLRCSTQCWFDTSGCDGCEPGAGLLGCASPALVDHVAQSLALVASDTEIAIARGAANEVRFTRFRPDLTPIGDGGCLRVGTLIYSVAMAATPSGYILAVHGLESAVLGQGGLIIYALDRQGVARGPGRLLGDGHAPLLAARPGGGPLLAWAVSVHRPNGQVEMAGRFALLREDGSEETVPAESFAVFAGDPFRPGDVGQAIHVGDGFLLAGREGATGALMALKIDGRGQVVSRTALADQAGRPQLAWRGQEARIIYFDDLGLRWRRLDRDGRPLGPPTSLAGPNVYQNSASLLAWGDGELIVLGTPTGIVDQSVALELARVTPSGAFAAPPVRITHEPDRIKSVQLARRGSDAVVGWLTGDRLPARIGLARMGPAP